MGYIESYVERKIKNYNSIPIEIDNAVVGRRTKVLHFENKMELEEALLQAYEEYISNVLKTRED